MTETVKIQVVFEETIGGATYRDAIYYPSIESFESAKLDGTHDAEQQRRLNTFDNILKNPPAPVETTKEQLEAEKAQLEIQIAALDVQIAEKGSK